MTKFDGARLREWRRSNGYSQAELAAELEVSRQSIIAWERSEKVDRVVVLAVKTLEHVPELRNLGGLRSDRKKDVPDACLGRDS